MRSWSVQGRAAALSGELDVPPWQPRRSITLAQLSAALINAEVDDFMGVLVWAGEINTSESGRGGEREAEGAVLGEPHPIILLPLPAADGREWFQWVFLMDDTQQGALPGEEAAGGGGDAAAASPAPMMLALRLMGNPVAIDWLPVSTLPPAAAAASSGAGRLSAVAAPQPVAVSCRDVLVTSFDAQNGMWVGDARDTSAVSVVSAGARAPELRVWARTPYGAALLGDLVSRVRTLVGS
jgi:hypothetical protein